MNEIELLRNQLATERLRVREVASACAAAYRAERSMRGPEALAPLREACTAYLAFVLDCFDRRDERLRELSARRPGSDTSRALETALQLTGRGSEALATLEAAESARESWQALARFIEGPWDTRRGAVEAALGPDTRVVHWRAFSGIDADSIRQERALYARFRAVMPGGGAPGPA